MDSSFNLAVHALVCLSHSGRSLSSEALAENICTNPARVRRVKAVNTRFVDCAWHSGDIDRDCAICSGMAGVMDGLYRQLNGQCAAYLSHITVADIENRLFAKGSE